MKISSDFPLILLHSERLKLHTALAFMSAVGLNRVCSAVGLNRVCIDLLSKYKTDYSLIQLFQCK